MEDNKDTVVQEGQNVEETTEKEPVVKTYTKEDLDNSFNAGVKKANSDWQKDEKYKEFIEWKKSNQNDSEKMAELESNNNTLINENKLLKAQIKVASSDVKKEFSKFVTNEVMAMVNDTVDFDTALKNYKSENPQFFGEVVVKKVQTSPNLNGGGTKPQSTNEIMNNILRSNRGRGE